MTETGRDVVERLRRQVEVGSRSIEWDEDFVEDSLPALLAVVEAAQEFVNELDCDIRESGYGSLVEGLERKELTALRERLGDLHSQASDEGKP